MKDFVLGVNARNGATWIFESLKPSWISISMQLLETCAWLQEKEMQLSSTFYSVQWSDLQSKDLYACQKRGLDHVLFTNLNQKSMRYN